MWLREGFEVSAVHRGGWLDEAQVNATALPIERLVAYETGLTVTDVEEIVVEWQRRLGLERWQIAVDWKTPAPDGEDATETLAEVSRTSIYDYADIRLGPSWPTWDRRKASLTIAHELGHLLVTEVWPAVESVEDFVPPAAWQVFKARYDHVEEQLVDRLATMFVDHLGVV